MDALKELSASLGDVSIGFDSSGEPELLGPPRQVEIGRSAEAAYTNDQMLGMLRSLEPVLDRTDLIGYVAARNARVLQDCAREYLDRLDALMAEYGEPLTDEEGRPTGQLVVPFASERFAEFDTARREWAPIAHRPNLYVLPVEEALGNITGAQLLALDWMFGEGGE